MSTTSTYTVTGITCGSCADKVSGAVNQIAGVTDTDVDVATGLVTVAGSDIDDTAVRNAITEAGYQVA